MPAASSSLTGPTNFAGAPAQNCPAGTSVPGGRTDPPAITAPAPMVQPFPTLQPMPSELPSPTFDEVTTLPAPISTLLPTVLPVTTARSPMADMSPTLTGAVSPLSRLAYQTLDPLPRVTAPSTFALGATNAAASTPGALPPIFTAVHGTGSFSM